MNAGGRDGTPDPPACACRLGATTDGRQRRRCTSTATALMRSVRLAALEPHEGLTALPQDPLPAWLASLDALVLGPQLNSQFVDQERHDILGINAAGRKVQLGQHSSAYLGVDVDVQVWCGD